MIGAQEQATPTTKEHTVKISARDIPALLVMIIAAIMLVGLVAIAATGNVN